MYESTGEKGTLNGQSKIETGTEMKSHAVKRSADGGHREKVRGRHNESKQKRRKTGLVTQVTIRQRQKSATIVCTYFDANNKKNLEKLV